MAVGLLMKAGNVSEELAVLNNEHSLNASLDTICGTMGSLGCGSFGCGFRRSWLHSCYYQRDQYNDRKRSRNAG